MLLVRRGQARWLIWTNRSDPGEWIRAFPERRDQRVELGDCQPLIYNLKIRGNNYVENLSNPARVTADTGQYASPAGTRGTFAIE